MSQGNLDSTELEQLRLDPQEIVEHQSKIRSQLAREAGVTFPAVEAGTRQNGVVLNLDTLDEAELRAQARQSLADGRICTFVPAAGAASRYLKVFNALAAARENDRLQDLAAAVTELRDLGDLSDLPFETLPPAGESDEELLQYGLAVQAQYGELPKGLTPATKEGQTFFDFKLLEHRRLNTGGRLVVVVAPGKVPEFQAALDRSSVSADLKEKVSFLIQGPELSTLRFDANGDPVVVDGHYVPVVGGHGELVRLFPQVSKLGPHASVFILNVDNVLGTRPQVIQYFERLAGFYLQMLELLDAAREACAQRNVPDELSERFGLQAAALGLPLERKDGLAQLVEIQRRLFHTPVELYEVALSSLWERLHIIYQRPLTVQGLVPNSGRDVGGTPLFIDLDGKKVKICLEMAHATPEDQEAYFRNPERATHFNPVFVLHELAPGVPISERRDPRFWMLTKKPFRGKDVYYHETVLYETIGNSLKNNLLFVEIPRFLFHPHKVFTDCRGKSLADYGFEMP